MLTPLKAGLPSPIYACDSKLCRNPNFVWRSNDIFWCNAFYDSDAKIKSPEGWYCKNCADRFPSDFVVRSLAQEVNTREALRREVTYVL